MPEVVSNVKYTVGRKQSTYAQKKGPFQIALLWIVRVPLLPIV